MIIFDIRLGCFSVLVQREPDWRNPTVYREGPGEITVDLPYARILLANYRRCAPV